MNRDLYADVTSRMLEALESGVVPWRKPWTSAGPHRNLVTGHEYRGINVFLTALSAIQRGFEQPAWLTMRQANHLGGRVRAGEKGTLVVFWQPHVDITRDERGEEVERRRLVFKKYYVWNVEQVDGIIMPELPPAAGANVHDEAERLWEGYAGRPSLSNGGSTAYYSPSLDEIVLPQRRAFESTTAYYHVLFHESIHSTGAKTRLARPTLTQAGRFGDTNYSQEELALTQNSRDASAPRIASVKTLCAVCFA